MPADYQSAAAALSIPTSPSPVTSPTSEQPDSSGPVPPWVRPNPASARRLSTRRPFSLHSTAVPSDQPFTTRVLQMLYSIATQSYKLFLSLSLLYQVLVVVGSLVCLVLGILALVYSHKIFSTLGPIAQNWSQLPGGWVLVWLITFATAFPPLFGYSTSLTVAGFVYGFPWGWPIVATASVVGSLMAFLTSRGIFSGYVHRLVGQDKRFVALGQVLRRDGLGVLTMIRLCPLPFSLSNGFLSTIPSISPWSFAAATALATPKLAVHVFIGSRLKKLAEEGDSMSAGDRAINFIFIIFGGVLGFVVGLVIYKRTMARAAELAREEAEEIGVAAGDDADDYADSTEESQLMRGLDMMDPDAAALAMDDDDISLWETEGANGGYRDGWDEEAAVEGNGDVKANGLGNENEHGRRNK